MTIERLMSDWFFYIVDTTANRIFIFRDEIYLSSSYTVAETASRILTFLDGHAYEVRSGKLAEIYHG